VRPTRGWERRARARASPSRLSGDARASGKDDSRYPPAGSFEPRGFLAGVLTTARPARRAENGGSGKGLLKSFPPRGLHRAVA
jgi:hypothetical protein